MAIDPDIRDQAYQFFIQEASELLQVIEAELLTLQSERSQHKVHNLMRAAHSIKGGSACVGLETITTLAHRLEDIFKALYHEELEIDAQLESLILQAYDCLRLPLMEEIKVGYFNAEQAISIAEPVFAQIEAQLGNFLGGEYPLGNSFELGVDIALNIFEVDVPQELDRLTNVLAAPEGNEVAGELRAIAEVLTGIGELLSLPGLRAIAQTTIAALDAHPEQALHIAHLALADFKAAQQAVISGDRIQGGSPSRALAELAASYPLFLPLSSEKTGDTGNNLVIQQTVTPTEALSSIPDLDEIFGLSASNSSTLEWTNLFEVDALNFPELPADEPILTEEQVLRSSVDDIFELADSNFSTPEVENSFEVNALNFLELPVTDQPLEIEIVAQDETLTAVSSLDDLFDLPIPSWETREIADSEVDVLNSIALMAVEENPVVDPATPETDQNHISTIPVTPPAKPPQELHSVGAGLPESLKLTQDLSEPVPKVELRSPDHIQKLVQSVEQAFDNLPPVTEDWGLGAGDKEIRGQGDTSASFEGEASTMNSAESLSVRLSAHAEVRTAARQRQTKGVISQLTNLSPHSPQDLTQPTPLSYKGREGQGEKLTEPAQQKPEDILTNPTPYLSVTVDLDRLERMNNLVGELAINRNSLSLQNEQLQGTVQELLRWFERFQKMANHLAHLSDQMLVGASSSGSIVSHPGFLSAIGGQWQRTMEHANFDSLEMDSYGKLHSLLQDTLEEMMPLEEIVGDVALLAGQSSQTLEGQRQMIGHLRDDLMWARMLPLSKILSRFPRTLRDLSTTYQKPVDLKLSGTGVLVDKAALEKLYDPLLHLLRNAFDHGIELPEVRRQLFKPERGQIEIRAYHQGSQTVIEVRDDGQGIHLERIRSRALELGLLSSEQLAGISKDRLLGLLFEPGFSTASQVSEISGRGVGLDVVRSQMRSLKGTVTVTTTPGQGTTFTLRIPLTLTIAKLLVCLVGMSAYALPADSIEEILIPKADQVKRSGKQRFLHWRERILPIFHLSELLDYAVPLPESIQSLALTAVPSPEDWAPPLLLIRQDHQFLALEIDRLVTEQELVIKPFGAAIAPPSYIYGCTILGDGSLIPVIDGAALIDQMLGQGKSVSTTLSDLSAASPTKTGSTDKTKVSTLATKSPLVLIVDDSIVLRQTLSLTLQRAGYQVQQARDGREAIEQLQQNSSIQIVVCDIEMPNMNGFEFLTHRRQDPLLSKIPVVMLTSRSSEKHRRLATQLGASAYFTKPYLEPEFLASIKTIIEQGVIGNI